MPPLERSDELRAPVEADQDGVHVVERYVGDERIAIMYCGLVVTFDADEWPSADFYDPSAGHKASCRVCRGRASA